MAAPTIKTPRLHLRPLAQTDLPTIIALRTSPAVFHWRTPDTSHEATQWLHSRLADPKCLIYCIEILPSTNNPLPTSNHTPQNSANSPEPLTAIGLTGGHHLPEVGYIFFPEYWGKGYATEALKAWMAMYWGLWPGGHPTLQGSDERFLLRAETGPEGEKSVGVLGKCGFVSEGKRVVKEEKGEMERDCWVSEKPVVGVGVE